MSTRGWLGCWAILAAACLAPSAAAQVSLERQIEQLLDASSLGATEVAIVAVDLDQRETLVAIHADEPMIPASNMKLVTTAAALDVLGPGFMFQTTLGLLEAPGGGEPDLLVRGDGDPGFGDPHLLALHGLTADDLLDQWLDAVEAAAAERGVKRFGRLVIDDRVFAPGQWVHPTWPDEQLVRWYCAQVAGLNFYLNCVDVLPEPTRPGAAARVRTYPEGPFFDTVNRARTGDRDFFVLDRRMGTNELIFRGTVKHRRSSPFQVTVHDPPMFFGALLRHKLAARGIAVGEVVRPGALEVLAEPHPLHVVQTSLPLVLARTNRDSYNLFAEALLKRMGRVYTGEPGDWDNGAAAVRQFLARRLGTRAAGVTIADGSGMSRDNRVTARLLVDLLGRMHRDAELGPLYRESLAQGGESGTLARRLGDGEGVVLGKSGYLSGVSALSGYLLLPGADAEAPGRTIGFSLLFNGFRPPVSNADVKAVQDAVIALIEESATPRSRLGAAATPGR